MDEDQRKRLNELAGLAAEEVDRKKELKLIEEILKLLDEDRKARRVEKLCSGGSFR